MSLVQATPPRYECLSAELFYTTKEGHRRREIGCDYGVNVRLGVVISLIGHDSQRNADASVVSNLWLTLTFRDAENFGT